MNTFLENLRRTGNMENHSKTLSENQMLEIFDQAKNNEFKIAMKYHNEGYNVTVNCFQQTNLSDIENSSQNPTINHECKSLLHYACQHKNYDVIKYLIRLGIDVNNLDSNGKSPLTIYLTSSFPLFVDISEQIETDKMVLDMFIKTGLTIIQSQTTINYMSIYINTKTIQHHKSTLSILIQFYKKKFGETTSGYLYSIANTMKDAIKNNLDKDIIYLCMKNQSLTKISRANDLQLILPYADVLYPFVDLTKKQKYSYGIEWAIMNEHVKHIINLTADRLLPQHIQVAFIKQFDTRKSYLSTHTRTLSETQQINMFDAAKEGDFSVALEFDKEGYDIITCSNTISVKESYSVLLYACLHDRLDLMQEFIDRGATLFSIFDHKCMLIQYILSSTTFNPEVAILLIKNGIDINFTNPVEHYFLHHAFSPLPDYLVHFFQQQGFSFQNFPDTLFKYLEKEFHFNETIFKQFVDLGLDVNNINGENLMLKVCDNYYPFMFEPLVFKNNIDCLIKLGLDVDALNKISDKKENSPIYLCLNHFSDITYMYPDYPDLIGYPHEYEDTEGRELTETEIKEKIEIITICLNYLNSNIEVLLSHAFEVDVEFEKEDQNLLFYMLDIFLGWIKDTPALFEPAKKILTTLAGSIDINFFDVNGRNIIMYYLTQCDEVNLSVLSMILEFGPDINIPNWNDQYMTPLLYAIHRKLPIDCIRLLVQAGAVIPRITPKDCLPPLFLYFDTHSDSCDLYPESHVLRYNNLAGLTIHLPGQDTTPEMIPYLVSLGCNILETYDNVGIFLYYLKCCVDKGSSVDDEFLEAFVFAGYHNNNHLKKNEILKYKNDLVCKKLVEKLVKDVVKIHGSKKDTNIFCVAGVQVSFTASILSKAPLKFRVHFDAALYPYELTPLNYFTLYPTFDGDTARATRLIQYLLDRGADFNKADITNTHILTRHVLSPNASIDITRLLVKHTDLWSRMKQLDANQGITMSNPVQRLVSMGDPVAMSLILAAGVDFTKTVQYPDHPLFDNLLIIAMSVFDINRQPPIIERFLYYITTYTLSHTARNIPNNHEAEIFRKYEAYKGTLLISRLMSYLLSIHPDLVENNSDYFFITFTNFFHKLWICIDCSMMYSYDDYLDFAVSGCRSVSQFIPKKNEVVFNFYRRIMQMLTGTTNKQHQVRRLKKHLTFHNRSLYHSASTGSVRSCVSEDYSMVKMLHERYYNTVLVLHPVDHTSVLMYAAKHGFVPMVKWVIRLGANVNAVDRKGMTALMYCCKYSQKYEVIELLLWHGADVGVKWKRKYTAFDMLYRCRVRL